MMEGMKLRLRNLGKFSKLRPIEQGRFWDGHGNSFLDEEDAIKSQDYNDMIDYWTK